MEQQLQDEKISSYPEVNKYGRLISVVEQMSDEVIVWLEANLKYIDNMSDEQLAAHVKEMSDKQLAAHVKEIKKMSDGQRAVFVKLDNENMSDEKLVAHLKQEIEKMLEKQLVVEIEKMSDEQLAAHVKQEIEKMSDEQLVARIGRFRSIISRLYTTI